MASQQVRSEIQKLLTKYTFFHDRSSRKAISENAGLDQHLLNQIDFEGSTANFLPLYIKQLSTYGNLKDGRNALQALLESLKDRVGMTDKEVIDKLIGQLSEREGIDIDIHTGKQGRRWLFIATAVILIAGISAYVLWSQRRTTPSMLPITELQDNDEDKYLDVISPFRNDAADRQIADPTFRFQVRAVESSLDTSTKRFTWSLSTNRAGLSILGQAFRVTSNGVRHDLRSKNSSENTLEVSVNECEKGDRLVAVVRISWQDNPSLSDMEETSSITDVLTSNVR
jgi:hypothetical protein